MPIRPPQWSPCWGGKPPWTSSLPSANFQPEAGRVGWLAPPSARRPSLRHQPGQGMAPRHRPPLVPVLGLPAPHRKLLGARAGHREALGNWKLNKEKDTLAHKHKKARSATHGLCDLGQVICLPGKWGQYNSSSQGHSEDDMAASNRLMAQGKPNQCGSGGFLWGQVGTGQVRWMLESSFPSLSRVPCPRGGFGPPPTHRHPHVHIVPPGPSLLLRPPPETHRLQVLIITGLTPM